MVSKTKSKSKKTTSHIYTRKDFQSKDGMLTTVWGPSTWHLLHTISFNYPDAPTSEEKTHYRDFIFSLKGVLPCGKCRANLVKNFKKLPLTMEHMRSRATFSKYVYRLHELINRMLKKKSGLTYAVVKDRYENFRARCALPYNKLQEQLSLDSKSVKDANKDEYHRNSNNTVNSSVDKSSVDKSSVDKSSVDKSVKENGCTEPIYGEKSKCILHIVPQSTKCETFQVDDKCIKKKIAK